MGTDRAAPAPGQAPLQGWLCSAPRSPRTAPGGSRQPVPWVPHGCSPQDVLQQERRCLRQDLLQPLLLPSAERSQDIAGHRHVTLWPPDTNPEPGHLLGRKRESLRSFISRAEAELEQEDSAAKGAGSEGAAPHVFQVVLSACSKKHDFGRGFCWAVLRSQAPARPGRAA